MAKSTHSYIPLWISYSILLIPAFSWGEFVPPTLQQGDAYHLIIITSSTVDGISGDVDFYNRFASEVANDDGSLVKGMSSDWRALVSTLEMNARENAPVSAPVYNLEGKLIAWDGGDLWDGGIHRGIRATELGEVINSRVWTGTRENGVEGTSGTVSPPPGDYAMGGSSPMVGWSANTDRAWVFFERATPTDNYPIYALSGRLIVPAPNQAPIADAGLSQTVTVLGESVRLDGSSSYDPDGESLTFSWAVTQQPAGSGATLSDPTSPTPSITIDVHGVYQMDLVVTDVDGATSVPDQVEIRTGNLPPVADAGGDLSVLVGDSVILDGRGSSDPNGDEIHYAWELLSFPQGSATGFDNANSSTPMIVPDRSGVFIAQLVVSDGVYQSSADRVTVVVRSPLESALSLMRAADDFVRALAPSRFKKENFGVLLLRKLAQITGNLEAGRVDDALARLDGSGLTGRLDGCQGGGAADNNDWLTYCEDQLFVGSLLGRVTDYLRR